MKDVILYKAMPIIALFFLSYVNLFTSPVFLVLSLLLIAPYMIYRYKIFINNKYLCLFAIMGLFGSLINLIGTNNGIGGTINFVVALGITVFCIENINIVRYFVLIFCIYTVCFVYTGLFINELDINALYENIGLSRNFPGFIMCTCCCFWGFFKYLKKHELPILLPIICTIFAFFLDGRSTLGVLFGLSLFCLYCTFRRFTIVFILCLIILIIVFLDDIINIYLLTNIATSGMETGRFDIWKGYIENLDLSTIILGLNTMDVPVIRKFNGNPHNAFLNFHYRMGLFGIIGLLLVIYMRIKIILKRRSFILFGFQLFLLIRIFFDACLGASTDYLIYTIFLYPLLYNQKYLRRARKRREAQKQIFRRHNTQNPIFEKINSIFSKVERLI